uniref:Cytochrome P450 2K1-like n=1 Tax=Oreochromis aureus TaxID=47969 RepID=A0A668TXG2_OREAU
MEILYVFLQGIYSIVLCLTVFVLIHFLSSNITQKDGKEPPGPTPLPMFGNLLQLDLKRIHVTLLKLSKKFGSIFTIYLGTKKVVVLVGYNAVKEALVDYAEVFGERDPTPIMDELVRGQGIIWANDDTWKEMRRFSMMNLKDFGMGKTEFEDKITEECHYLMEAFKQFKEKIREELSRVMGDHQVQFKDRTELPFTNAVIHETQRLTAIAALGLPHRTSQDITFRGHFIKKGTAVYPFLFSVLSDESEWEKPYTFYPEHFLDKDGKFIQRDAFMVFSAGRRICLGASLARMELFIFFTTLLQHFRITLPPGVSEDELLLSPSDSLILSPSNVRLCAVPL